MNDTFDVLSDARLLKQLEPAWDSLVTDDPHALQALDASSTYCWFESVVAAMPEAAAPRVLVRRTGSRISGLWPLIAPSRGLLGSHLCGATELHGGRNGLLIAEVGTAGIEEMLKHVADAFPDWVSLRLAMVCGNPQGPALLAACRNLGFAVCENPIPAAPYFHLPETDDAIEHGISKNLRQAMRKARNKAVKLGTLRVRVFQDLTEFDELIDIVLGIERQSWKQSAGSAITSQPRQERFYRALFRNSMRKGLFIAFVIYLNDKPLAHQCGLIRDGVFMNLKHSMIETHTELSASNLLTHEYLSLLRKLGVKTVDFMAAVEPHKMKWSDKTMIYERVEYTVFRNNLNGRLLSAARHLKAKWRAKPGPAPEATNTKQAEQA